jgi:nucleotide-binding universal stress UspA family protein
MAADRELRVIVATDGSAPARAAIATVLHFPWPPRTDVRAVTSRHARADDKRLIFQATLDRRATTAAAAARRALARRWPDAEVTIVDTEPVAGIVREAERFDAGIIALGWRGHGAVRRFLIGSVARGVVRAARQPILLVRRRQRHIRRIVVGVDGSANAQRALAFVGRLRPSRGGQMTLFTAVERMGLPSQKLASRRILAPVAAEVRRINAGRAARATKGLDRAAASLIRAGWRVRTVVTAGAPLRDLLATVDAAGADLLVVGARGISGVRHLLLGSVADGALNRCPVPVLLVR